MRVKEVKVSETERFVICHNPDAAQRDAHIRAQLIAQLEELIAGSDKLPAMKRGELRGRISTKPGLHRYLRVTPGGLLRIDKAKCKTEANLDGKYLLRCSEPRFPAEDIALGYLQLLQVERGSRDMKTTLELYSHYHRFENRICSDIILAGSRCSWSGSSRPPPGGTCRVREDLQEPHAGASEGPGGTREA